MAVMNIGEASNASGISSKMIRHYESIGLIPEAGRTQAGYRLYGEKDVHMLVFIRQARGLGFSTEEIRELLGLWQNRRRSSRQVKALALEHIAQLDVRIGDLEAMRKTLLALVESCQGDDRPDCPILEKLADRPGGHS